MPTLDSVVKMLEEIGYVQVHTWYESHGDGGQVTLQKSGYITWKARCMVVSFNREGNAKDIFAPNDKRNYLMAKNIRENKWDDFVPVGRENISSCCTASTQRFCQRGMEKDGVWVIHSVAGHGEWAEWEAK